MSARSKHLFVVKWEQKMRKQFFLLVVLCSAAGNTRAQQAKPASKAIVLKAARLFDGNSNTIVKPGLVVVVDGKIVVTGANAAVPAGAEVLDLGDATLLPGFIDAHTHLTDEASDDWKQDTLDELQKTVAERALDSTVNARKTLTAGFTTVRDVGSSDYLDVGFGNAIRHGKVGGPRMLVATYAIGSTGGHCDGLAGFRAGLFGRETGPEEGVANGSDQIREAVRLAHKY